jgi:hypothetical protein
VAQCRSQSRGRGRGRTGRGKLLARLGLLTWIGVQLSVTELARCEDAHASKPEAVLLDRVVVRFSAPEGPGRERPYFIYERELAFEARLLALSDSTFVPRGEPFRQHHVQAALERRIAETLLASLPIDPPLAEQFIDQQIEAAEAMVWDTSGGKERVSAAARAEGISSLEQRSFFRRRAVASLYLHQMVAPMLEPSQLELRLAALVH